MQFKHLTLLTAAVSVTYAQTVSFNATEIIQELMALTNLAQVTNSLAGTITLGNAVSTLPVSPSHDQVNYRQQSFQCD